MIKIKLHLQSIYLYWRSLVGEDRGFGPHLRMQFRSWQLYPKAIYHFRKDLLAVVAVVKTL